MSATRDMAQTIVEVTDRLIDTLDALERIFPRFVTIKAPGDFLNDDQSGDYLDSIRMVLCSQDNA